MASIDETLEVLRRKQTEGAVYEIIHSSGFGRKKVQTVAVAGLNYEDARTEERRLMKQRTDKGFGGPCYFLQRRKAT